MPFAKWRRGTQGQYHYHALVLTPEGRLEDPSLVLGMGQERAFLKLARAGDRRRKNGPFVHQYARAPT